MKTKLLLSALILLSPFAFILSPCTAQVPMGFNYQAIARDGGGNILANQALPVKIDIQTSTGTVIYEELFSSITSNQFGLISLVVGTGVWQSGLAPSFSAIDWKSQPLYIKTIIQYPGTTWTTMGTSQIWAVPYSLTAKEVTGPLSKLGITGTTDVMDEALFEVKNKKGNTVFAVYNEGIRAYVGDGSAKGVKGGFSVGGYDATKSDTIRNIFVLSTDSARFYLDSKPQNGIKGVKGGFSVGGYDMTKSGTPFQNYLDVTPATTKIFTTDTLKGFSVGNVSTGSSQSYMKLTPSNYLIGQEAGKNLTTGLYNSIIGYKSGPNTTIGFSNTFLGYKSGYTNISGTNNTFIGNSAGYFNTSGTSNVFVGPLAGYRNSTGYANVFVGVEAGRENTTGERGVNIGIRAGVLHRTGEGSVCIGYEAGSGFDGSNDSYGEVTGQSNTYIGLQAGKTNLTGSFNTAVGFQTGIQSRNGSRNTYLGAYIQRQNIYSDSPNDNVYLGYGVAYNNQEGYQNVMIGSGAGQSLSGNSEPSGSVFIGYNAGQNETGSNKLYIDNSNTASPLIYGDFSDGSEKLVFNGKVGIGTSTPSTKLHIISDGTNRGLRISGASSNNYTEAQFAGDGREYRFGVGGSALTDGAANKFYIWDNNASAYRMVLDASGNVGIGTNTPSEMLDVRGIIRNSVNTNYDVWIQGGAVTSGTSRNLALLGVIASDQLYLNYGGEYTGGVVIGGNVGIGTTSPGTKLEISSDPTSAYHLRLRDITLNKKWDIAVDAGYGDATNDDMFILNNVGTHIAVLTNSGNIGIGVNNPTYKLQVNGQIAGVGAYVNTSDARFKKDIEPISGALEKIMALQGISFNWDQKGDSGFEFDSRNHLGFSAQDLEKVVPQVVYTANDKMQTKSVAYGDLVPLLTEAIKEQQKVIDSQNNKIRDLESRLEKVEALIK